MVIKILKNYAFFVNFFYNSKFDLLNTVKSKQWNLYYQSGNAYCSIENGIAKFDTANDCFTGCFAILEI